MNKRDRNNLIAGIGFITPNVLGFLTFTLIPLVFSFYLAFTNWDLRFHNIYKDGPIQFVGLDNFLYLLNPAANPDFFQYLGNTLFMMMGMPLGIAASLISAILLSQDLTGGSRRNSVLLAVFAAFVSLVMVGSVILLAYAGVPIAGMTIVFVGTLALILMGGSLGGLSVYRTLFYIPNFASGVATMLLWKKLYDPINGPINTALAGPLAAIGNTVNSTPAELWTVLGYLVAGLAILVAFFAGRKLARSFVDGDAGMFAVYFGLFLASLPLYTAIAFKWIDTGVDIDRTFNAVASLIGFLPAIAGFFSAIRLRERFHSRPGEGFGSVFMTHGGLSVLGFILIGLGLAVLGLPARSGDADGLAPPQWLQDVAWAKPSLMFMGFWGAIGSQTMLLYLAALTNVPQELYEAAEIDGANKRQRFWNVTWPQLAPTTFFVVVMGTIGGLQSGFEAARVMTLGGPAGSTTTIAYYIYNEGFETGRLGFASAIAWTLFVMVLVITLFNWKFGNRYVND